MIKFVEIELYTLITAFHMQTEQYNDKIHETKPNNQTKNVKTTNKKSSTR